MPNGVRSTMHYAGLDCMVDFAIISLVTSGDNKSAILIAVTSIFIYFYWYSLLCGPISPVVNLEMSSTARFFCGHAIYGCSGLGNCRMLNFLSIAFCVIDLISMLIT